jgi:hypothetical protein
LVWPEKDYVEKLIDTKWKEINEAEEIREEIDEQIVGPPPEETEDYSERLERLYGKNTDKELEGLQPRAIVSTYKASKTLERLTRVLIFLTIILGLLTAITILVLLRG